MFMSDMLLDEVFWFRTYAKTVPTSRLEARSSTISKLVQLKLNMELPLIEVGSLGNRGTSL